MDHRQALLDKLEALDALDPDHLPVVGIDDYFHGNTEEESIAPNQWGEGRPPLAELYRRFKALEARPDVQGVYVGLHESWGEALDDDDQWPAAENVHILTSAPLELVEAWIEGMHADGVGFGWPYGEHVAAPKAIGGMRVCTVFWD